MDRNPDPDRLLGDVLRLGAVASVDLATARCTFRVSDDLVTGPIPWVSGRAGDVALWSPPSVGEQGVLFCPEGDVAAGIVLLGLYSTAHPAPGSDGATLVLFADGSVVRYDATAHRLELTLAAGAKLSIVAPGGAAITADVTISGKLSVTGDITSSGDVKAGTVSLRNHVTTGVKAGSDLSGAPKP